MKWLHRRLITERVTLPPLGSDARDGSTSPAGDHAQKPAGNVGNATAQMLNPPQSRFQQAAKPAESLIKAQDH
ncbi:hypothetical protein O6P37_10340 [Mycobacterium sp. CPCC 205372]|uniref:Uncharacterized protein n=1 Tax=Mycobacterium hippophais TaxID=3016340 RepID=A0ABT4PRS2_9MYCO|nr:hypothetical protein [Mycobacterium hippophais]MCZ8379262.1 hypothetical protein [Mycobacterium hippophais]